MTQTNCPSREQIAQCLNGRLTESETDDLLQHLEACPLCEDSVRAVEADKDFFLSPLQRPAPRDQYRDEAECARALANAESLVHGETLAASPADEPQSNQQPPRMLREYELLDKIGQGGMGTVYKAWHTKLHKHVALKVLPANRMDRSEAVARFEREMKAIGTLNSPHIVQAHDAGEHDGTHFLVMELVNGIDLSKLARRLGRLPVDAACELIRQAAAGLQHAFERGQVHRDIKPSNLMVDGLSFDAEQAGASSSPAPIVKILDFGLALLHGEQASGEEITSSGQLMGTIDYMAPEQATNSHNVDTRADIYSLGATLYRLLAGQPPVSVPRDATAFARLNAIVEGVITPIEQLRSDLPHELYGVIDRMLSKDPGDRFETAADVAQALAPFAAGCDLTQLVVQQDADDTTQLYGTESREKVATRQSAAACSQPGKEQEESSSQPKGASFGMIAVSAILLLVFATVIVIKFKDRWGRAIGEVQIKTSPGMKTTIEQQDGGKTIVNVETTSDTPADEPHEGFVHRVSIMPTNRQINAVVHRLKNLNPKFDGRLTTDTEDEALVELALTTDNVTDISPFAVFKTLKRLTIRGSDRGKGSLADISPLRGLALTYLDCRCNPIRDLAPLSEMKLTELLCEYTHVCDLRPLRGMPLERLDCYFCGEINDLSPLAGMRLKELKISWSGVTDLSALRGAPLVRLSIGRTGISDLSPLQGMKLEVLECDTTPIHSLSPLSGMPLRIIDFRGTKVEDPSPLKESPLEQINGISPKEFWEKKSKSDGIK